MSSRVGVLSPPCLSRKECEECGEERAGAVPLPRSGLSVRASCVCRFQSTCAAPMLETSGNVRSGSRLTDSREANLRASSLSYRFNTPPPLCFRYPNADPAGRRGAHDHATGPRGSAERPRVPPLPLAPSARAGAERVQRRAAPRRALPRPVRG